MGEAKRIITDLADSWMCNSGGHSERRHRREHEKPGTTIQRLNPEVRKKLEELKSEDISNVRWPPDWVRTLDTMDF